jgi:hypothetical protein
MTFQIWENRKGPWNWRIDYRDGARIAGRDCRTSKSARGAAAWGDYCHRRYGERAAEVA